MEIGIKIIEFSSDVFSKSTQLKDIIISPLFSNTNFSINIFEAISKNEEYKIKTHSQIIKIGLFNGKSLLGIGEININKKSQKIKISSEDKNKNKDNNLFLNNGINNAQDNDYFITIECNNSNTPSEKNKTINTREINQYKKKKKNASMDYTKKNNNINYNNNTSKNREKISKINLFLQNVSNNGKKAKKNNKIYNSRDNINMNNKTNTITHNNNFDDENNSIKCNSTIIKDNNNSLIKNKLLASGEPKIKNRNNKNDYNKTKDKNKDKDKDNDNINKKEIEKNNIEKDKEINIFNLSFQKELFSDGVLILNDNNGADGKDNDKLNQFKNIEINEFDGLVKDFDLIYNNVSNNNTFSVENIKDNFLLEYQYFLEKTSDIFNLYSKLSSKINNQNLNIQKYIKNYSNKMKILLKKDKILKIKKQNIDIDELFGQNNYQENKKYYEDEIVNIKNKLSLINNINNDILFLIKKEDQGNNKTQKEQLHTLLTDIFQNLINNENNNESLKDNMNIINLILNKNKSIKTSRKEEIINDDDENNYEDNNDNEDGNNKIDLEALKNKIDKMKHRYIKETGKRKKIKTYVSLKKKNKKGKKMYNNSNPNFSNKKAKTDKVKDLNIFTPSGEQRNKITSNFYLDNNQI